MLEKSIKLLYKKPIKSKNVINFATKKKIETENIKKKNMLRQKKNVIYNLGMLYFFWGVQKIYACKYVSK